MPIRFQQVADNLYRGGKPSPKDLHLLKDIFGVKTIISLDGPIGNSIHPIVKKLGMNHIVIPVGDPDDKSIMGFFQDNISKLLTRNPPVYVHCRHGSDRTGMAIALYRINNQNWKPKKAYQEALKFNFGDKLDNHACNAYRQIILGNKDNSALDDTIVSTMQDQFQQGNVPPAFSPQQSFAPQENIPMQGFDGNMPFSGIHGEQPNPLNDPGHLTFQSGTPETVSERKRELARMYLDSIPNQVPMSGQVNAPPYGLRGVGPSEPQFFVDLY